MSTDDTVPSLDPTVIERIEADELSGGGSMVYFSPIEATLIVTWLQEFSPANHQIKFSGPIAELLQRIVDGVIEN